MNKKYEILWRDEVHKCVTIESKSKYEAYKKWRSGDYSSAEETDCETISDESEIMSEMTEIK